MDFRGFVMVLAGRVRAARNSFISEIKINLVESARPLSVACLNRGFRPCAGVLPSLTTNK